MNSFGYKGWNILHYIHIAIPVSKKPALHFRKRFSWGICNVEMDTFSAVMIQAYKLKFMNWYIFFYSV